MAMNRVVRNRNVGRYNVASWGGAARAVGRFAKNVYKKKSSGGKNADPSASGYLPSSYQKDRQVTYKKKRTNRRRVKRIVKYRNKIWNAMDDRLGSRWVTFGQNGTDAINTSQQSVLSFMLGGGTTTGGQNDLPQVIALFNQNVLNALSTDLLTIRKMTGYLTLTNIVNPAITTYLPILIVTVYYFKCRKNMISADISPADKFGAAATANYAFGTSPPVTTGFFFTNPSCTPFNAGQWCQNFLITRVEKVILQPGQETTLQFGSYREKTVRNEMISQNACIKGVTMGVMVTVTGGLNPAGQFGAGNIGFNFRRVYEGKHMVGSRSVAGVVS